jgi:hypothetical protein
MTLKPIIGEGAAEQEATVRVAHDGEFIYVLFTVDDDFNWSDLDPRFAGAPSVMWPIEPAAGPHMGGDDPSGLPNLGLVDLWYWRLECPIGVEQGGSVETDDGGDPGNDASCNLDDEYATEPDAVEDDDDAASENSLLGVFGHSNPVDDGEGTWYFEFRRPLQTGDPFDAQFEPGSTARMALAYWDPDAGGGGWGGDDHVQSSDEGWIDVRLGRRRPRPEFRRGLDRRHARRVRGGGGHVAPRRRQPLIGACVSRRPQLATATTLLPCLQPQPRRTRR